MKHIRPLVGAVLLSLLLAPGAALADRVIDITPGSGSTSLAPPSVSGDKSNSSVESLPVGTEPRSGSAGTSSRGDSDREGGY